MRVIAIFSFIEEPAVSPDLGRAQDLLTGPQDNPHRLVVEDQRKRCHACIRRQNSCRHVLMLRAVVPTGYGFRKNEEGQSDTFNADFGVSC